MILLLPVLALALPASSGLEQRAVHASERAAIAPPTTVFSGYHPLAPGDAIWLSHEGQVWTLTLTDSQPYTLQIGDHPHRAQELGAWSEAPEEALLPVLRWAGDLDGDQRLDLIVEIPNGPERQEVVWLSALAEGEAHVAPAP